MSRKGYKYGKTRNNTELPKKHTNVSSKEIYDPVRQELHIWLKDGAMVKPGKQTLIFSVTYEGQGVESNGKPGPRDIKVPVTVLR